MFIVSSTVQSHLASCLWVCIQNKVKICFKCSISGQGTVWNRQFYTIWSNSEHDLAWSQQIVLLSRLAKNTPSSCFSLPSVKPHSGSCAYATSKKHQCSQEPDLHTVVLSWVHIVCYLDTSASCPECDPLHIPFNSVLAWLGKAGGLSVPSDLKGFQLGFW